MASTPKKHGSVWRIQVNKSGVRESGSFATRREAQDWAAKTEALAMAAKQGAYFRPWRTAFQSEGGHDFKLIADSVSDDRGHRFKVKADSISS